MPRLHVQLPLPGVGTEEQVLSPPPTRFIYCDGLPFEIIGGHRVWLTPPPPEVELYHGR